MHTALFTSTRAPRPMADILLDRLTALKQAVVHLRRRGFSVIGVDASRLTPGVQVDPCALTRALIATGEACYYQWRFRDGLPERVGQFMHEGVRITWTERGYE